MKKKYIARPGEKVTIEINRQKPNRQPKNKIQPPKGLLTRRRENEYQARRIVKNKLKLKIFDAGWFRESPESSAWLPLEIVPRFVDERDDSNPQILQSDYDKITAALFDVAAPETDMTQYFKHVFELIGEFRADWTGGSFFPVRLEVTSESGSSSQNYNILDFVEDDTKPGWTDAGLQISSPSSSLQISGEFGGQLRTIELVAPFAKITESFDADAPVVSIDFKETAEIYVLPGIVRTYADHVQSHNTIFNPPPPDAFYHIVRFYYAFISTVRLPFYDRSYSFFKNKVETASYDYGTNNIDDLLETTHVLADIPGLPALKIDGVPQIPPVTGNYDETFTDVEPSEIFSLPNPAGDTGNFHSFTVEYYEPASDADVLLAIVKTGEKIYYVWKS